MNPIDLLHKLVAIPSPSGEEKTASGFFVDAMREMGLRAWIDPAGNPTGQIGEGNKEILLLGHIDTFAGQPPVEIRNGRLYGRGAVDAKGPLAAFTCAAAGWKPVSGWRLTIIGAVGEEADSRGARALLGRPAPAMLIIGEPSSWERICLGYKGVLGLQAAVTREEFHSSASAIQSGACDSLFEFWTAVRASCGELNQGRERNFDQITPALRSLQSASDGLNSRASLNASFRLPPAFDASAFQERFSAFEPAMEITWGELLPACRAEKNTLLVRSLLAGIRAQGGKPSFTMKSGTSDMNLVLPVWNCPAAAYGPGNSALDHTPAEHIELSEYSTSIAVLSSALTALTNQQDL